VNLIGATTTKTGLKVRSALDTNQYPAGRSVSDDELAVLNLRRDPFHGDWNYALLPRLALLSDEAVIACQADSGLQGHPTRAAPPG